MYQEELALLDFTQLPPSDDPFFMGTGLMENINTRHTPEAHYEYEVYDCGGRAVSRVPEAWER